MSRAGYVLVGGRSSRMGRDKALLPFRGVPLAQFVARTVASAATQAVLVGDPSRYAAFGYPVIPDRFPGEGPLGGILTALHHTSADWSLVVACDMPELSAEFLGRLLEAAEHSGAEALIPVGPSGQPEPLCAVYHRNARPAIEMAFARLMLSFFSTDRRKKLYQKHYPLWGGITNMNLNSLWEQHAGESPIDYFRAVSTGPVTPLVLSLTTVRDCLNVGLTFRSTVFSAPQIDGIKRDFLDAVSHLEGQP